MLRRLFFASLLCALFINQDITVAAQDFRTAIPESLGVSTERLERLTNTLQGYVDAGRLPGGVALVARKGHIVYHKAFGMRDIEEGERMETDDIFRIASQTKALISVGVMILQEEGRLLINDPVGTYLPEYMETKVAAKTDDGYEVVAAKRPITIRDLLTHTAGIGYGNGPAAAEWEAAGIQGWYFADRDEPIRETVARIAELPMDAQPGEAYVYGYNTDILGALIEVVSGQPLDEFLNERVLGPLGMSDTHFYLPPSKQDRLSVVYSLREDGGMGRAPDPGHMVGQGAYVEGPRISFSGGAGLLSTSMDYARFLQMMLNGGKYNGNRILAPSTVELMTVDHLDGIQYPWSPSPNTQTMGLGFWIIEEPGANGLPGSVGSYGWGGAYHSTYWVDPEKELVVVYFTQVIPAAGLDDHDKLRALVYQSLVD